MAVYDSLPEVLSLANRFAQKLKPNSQKFVTSRETNTVRHALSNLSMVGCKKESRYRKSRKGIFRGKRK